MTHTRWLALLLAGVCPLLAVGPVCAQGRRASSERSYVPLPPAEQFPEE